MINSPEEKETSSEEEEEEPDTRAHATTRSDQVFRSAQDYTPLHGGKSYSYVQHLHTQTDEQIFEYELEQAHIATNISHEFNQEGNGTTTKIHSFIQTHSLKKGLKWFKKEGYEAALGEMRQLHDRQCFQPIDVATLTPTRRKRALESLTFLGEKRYGRIKARIGANGARMDTEVSDGRCKSDQQ